MPGDRIATIYGLVDPRDAELRYVGKTVDIKERLYKHAYRARRGCKLHLRQWLRVLLAEQLSPVVVVLDEIELAEANAAERRWIAFMRELGCDLTNLTPGGDGQSPGFKMSEEAKRKLSFAGKGRPHSAEHKARIAAKLGSPELREKKRRLMAQRWADDHPQVLAFKEAGLKVRSPEHNQRIKSWWTPERRAERAAKMVGRKMSAASIEKARLARLGKPCLAGRKPHNVSPEGRARLRAKMLGNRLGERPC